MVILGGQQLFLLFLKPPGLIQALTFGAIAIPPRAVRELLVCAGIADQDVASEGCGTTVGDGPNCACLLVVQYCYTITVRPEDVGEFELWTSCTAVPGRRALHLSALV
jgi:hypothetical protein